MPPHDAIADGGDQIAILEFERYVERRVQSEIGRFKVARSRVRFGQERVALHLLMLFGIWDLEQQSQRARGVAVQVRFRRAKYNVDLLVGACEIPIDRRSVTEAPFVEGAVEIGAPGALL